MSMRPKSYLYKGNTYTLSQLSELFPDIKSSVLGSRLRKGMTVEEAVAPQVPEDYIPEEFRNKELIICFDAAPPVLPVLQPAIQQRYLAVPHSSARGSKMFYIIKVRGNNLIVYPGEFRILGIAKKCAELECTPTSGERACCELNESGYCMGSYGLNCNAQCS